MFQPAHFFLTPKHCVPSTADLNIIDWRNGAETTGPHAEIDCAAAEQLGCIVYEILHTGGFLMLYRKPLARYYWLLQALSHHLTPDWKIHWSIREEDFSVAWDSIAACFIALRCNSGLKLHTQVHQL